MLKKIIAVLATFGACAAFAQDASAPAEKTNAIYIHPISLITTASVPKMPLWFFLTYEKELNHGQSLAFQPNLLIGTVEEVDLMFTGLKGSYRKYLNGEKAEGMYVSPSLEYTYMSLKDSHGKATANQISILAYVGYRAKWEGSTLYVDAGLGRGFASVSADAGVNTASASSSGLDYGFNFGLGMPF